MAYNFLIIPAVLFIMGTVAIFKKKETEGGEVLIIIAVAIVLLYMVAALMK